MAVKNDSPILCAVISNEGFVVEVDLSKRMPKLEPGSTILSINGHKSVDLIKKYTRYFGGLDAWKKVSVKDAIRKLLLMDDIKSPFEIVASQGRGCAAALYGRWILPERGR